MSQVRRALAKRLEQYGPFPPTRLKLVVVSTGSDIEDHGPAMAPGSDTFFAQAFCSGAAVRTGVRYLAHAPFTTDRNPVCAQHWGPIYLSHDEYFRRTADYFAKILDFVDPRPEGVVIHVPWHGQHTMAERLGEFTRRLAVRKVRLVPDIVVEAAFSLKEVDYRGSALRDLAREAIEGKLFQHAGFLDYCVAEALGHLDKQKLAGLKKEMEADRQGTLRKYPAVADLVGYMHYDAEVSGCLRRASAPGGGPLPLVEKGLDPKWQASCPIVGKAIVARTTDMMADAILGFERELFS